MVRVPRRVSDVGGVDDGVLRWAAPAGTAVLGVLGAGLSGAGALPIAGAAGVVVMMTAVALRPVSGWALLAVASTSLALFAVVCDGRAGNVGWFGVCLLAAWIGAVERPRFAVAFVALAAVLFVGEWIVLDDGWGAWIAGTAISGGAGAMGRRQRILVEQLRQAQAGLAERARAEERSRIAHEIHDVIGHALTVSLIHVTSARVALAEDPAEADASLAEAERLGRQSLAEVRTVVGLMRDAGGTTPLPGADDLDALVEEFRRAGTDVSWDVAGDAATLTATEGLAVYRILQESLTNAVRHAPGSSVVAALDVAHGRARLVVTSHGACEPSAVDGGGLASMRARAEALGGALNAGPTGGDWRVEAVLPA